MTSTMISSGDQFWDEYREILYRFILKRVKDSLLADDIVQDVLLKAHTRLHTLKDQDRVLPWLYQITRNTIVDYYRQHRPSEALSASLMIEEMPLTQEAERELACCILPLVKQLPPRYQQAMLLAEIEGLSQQEVAIKQRLSLPGAKSRVQRGRRLLKKLLLECCRVELDRRGSILNYAPNKACDGCTEKE